IRIIVMAYLASGNTGHFVRCFQAIVRVDFFFNDTATTEIYTLSLHDALPISARVLRRAGRQGAPGARRRSRRARRSEEHTSELQSLTTLVCRLLLEKNRR